MLLWPARIVTADATYEPAHFRASVGEIGELLDKAGQVVATISEPSVDLVFESAGFVRQRWQVEGANGERWLAELIDHCGCGSTRVTGTNAVELAW